MRGPNIQVVFSPKKNSEELQLHQTLKLFSEFCPSILDKSVPAIFLKSFGFNFVCVLVFFKK